METLISVAYRECSNIMCRKAASDQSQHLVYLLCSLQASMMLWIYTLIGEENNNNNNGDGHAVERTLIDCK